MAVSFTESRSEEEGAGLEVGSKKRMSSYLSLSCLLYIEVQLFRALF